ncbi:UNVERIFIED_CONTAM: hypothetical protein PYX00_007908 [Menopon gallinae]|uniref:Uncharacterized protein n=1 Tax=Menopon gallinae TaxID=328185 RepID=A0AAW2HL38_9NEOP
MTLYRGVKNGALEHKINDRLVSYLHYEEMLDSLNINVRHKNIVFHKAFFHDAIWGNPEDLELLVAKTLRVNSNLSEWKKARNREKYLKETTKTALNLTKLRQSHGTIETFVNSFRNFTEKVESHRESLEMGHAIEEDSSASGTLSSTDTSFDTRCSLEDTSFEPIQIEQELEEKENELLEKYIGLKEKELRLLCHVYFYEAKLSSNPANTSLLLNRILKLQTKLRNEESSFSSLWGKQKDLRNHLDELAHKISMDMATLWDVQQSYYLKNRMTIYGRFIDYLQPNNFVRLLRIILGENVLNSHLCDEMETAISCCKHLKGVKYEGRETFIAFENYSVKLKDLLLASGEKGIKINTIQELQIFLCKLKQYGFITQIPIIVGRRFNFKLEEGKNYSDNILYPENGIYLQSDGLISYSCDSSNNFETEETVTKRMSELLREQELKYKEYGDLNFRRLKILYNIHSLESDISDLKRKYRRCASIRNIEPQSRPLSDVYENFETLFQEHEKIMEDVQQELEESDEYLYIGSGAESSGSSDEQVYSRTEALLSMVSADFSETSTEKTKVKQELLDLQERLNSMNVLSDKVWSPPVAKFVLLELPKNRCSYYYDNELEKLRILMSKDEVEEFENWKNWRKETIASLSRDVYDTEKLMKSSKEVSDLTASRKKILSPLLEHCSHHLTSTFQFIMDTSLPFLELGMSHSEDGLQLLTSLPEDKINIIPIAHFNTFIKFVAALSFLLELVIYDKIPFIWLDDVNEFLPQHKDTFEAVLSHQTLERILTSNENINFQVLTRIGQYLSYLVKKNTSGNTVRTTRRTGKTGPMQIIYFASNDLVHAAHHQLWIRKKDLPDDYISVDSNLELYINVFLIV